ncbi:hypothetical protein KEM60_03022 [Austwickia sp. TVS 96-490-7B]|uniref:GNAT family N-acetyltransferase n=1 Tax=Austwickia sp. TVS 96-490-7B TaxID=2830843 RepID=UPI001C563228|nr:GNAT family N-acetyltransferase [Austwickia sp. TVS 96-490-7B]MBW3086793.1 hypothetical protein [Austwickia sp. TVS 96-490-7B]
MSEIVITDNAAASRWEAVQDGQLVGFAEYVEADGVVAFTHTEVPSQFGGRGIAGKLAAASLARARERGAMVRPQCSFYAGWIARNPQYADLVVEEARRS